MEHLHMQQMHQQFKLQPRCGKLHCDPKLSTWTIYNG